MIDIQETAFIADTIGIILNLFSHIMDHIQLYNQSIIL